MLGTINGESGDNTLNFFKLIGLGPTIDFWSDWNDAESFEIEWSLLDFPITMLFLKYCS